MLVHHRAPSMKQLEVLLLTLDGMLVHNRIASMRQLGVLLLTLDGMLAHHRVPSMKQLGVLLLTLDGITVNSTEKFHRTLRGNDPSLSVHSWSHPTLPTHE